MKKEILIKYDRKQTHFFLDDDSIYERMVKSKHFYEYGMLTAMQKDLKLSGGLWLDVGANFGNHAVFFDQHCKADSVIAFEPVAYSFSMLSGNVKSNHCKVDCRMVGVSNYNGTGSFKQGKSNRWVNCVVVPGYEFDVVTLDSLNLKGVNVMKVDVEGDELNVLLGAKNLINEQKPHIFVEAWDSVKLKPIQDFLFKLGYKQRDCYNAAPTYHFSG